EYRLAEVTHFLAGDDESERLEADTFDLGTKAVKQLIIELEEGVAPRLLERNVRQEKVTSGSRTFTKTTSRSPADWIYRPPVIIEKDIVAVWVLLLRTGRDR